MTRCCVPKCKNDTSVQKKSSGITYHLFPKEPNRRSLWIKALNRGSHWCPTKCHRICSQHFAADCFKTTHIGKLNMLKRDAVPTLNLPEYDHQMDSIEFCDVKSISNNNKRKDFEPSEEDGPLVAKLKARIIYLEAQNKLYKHKLAIVQQNNKRKTEKMDKMKSIMEKLVKFQNQNCDKCKE